MNTVLPVADSSWTIPRSFFLKKGEMGITNRPSRTAGVVPFSTIPSSTALRRIDDIFLEILPSVADFSRRISPSFEDAVSFI